MVKGIKQVFATHVNNTSDDIAVGEEILRQGIVVSKEGPQALLEFRLSI